MVEMAKTELEDRTINPDIPSLDDSTVVGLLESVGEKLVMLDLVAEDIHRFKRDHLGVKKVEQSICC